MNLTMPDIQEKRARGWSRRKKARPGEILDAALKVFAEKGFAATRMEDIAQVAGVTKGTIYLYFPGKEEVFKTLAREVIGQALANASRQLGEFHGSPRERLILTVTAIATFLNNNERIVALPKIIIAESGNFPELARFWRSEIIDKAVGLIGKALDDGIASGDFRPLPSAFVAKLCISPVVLGIIWRATFARYDDTPFDLDKFLATHLDILLHGLERSPKSGTRSSDRERNQTEATEGKAP